MKCSFISGPELRRGTSPEEALARFLSRIDSVETELLDLASAVGRVLAEPLVTDRPSPPCDVAAMDGYAARLSDLSRERLPVSGEALAGQPPKKMPQAAVLRINTGAPLPTGAELVIKREDTIEDRDYIRLSVQTSSLRPGENIRRQGENAGTGEIVLPSGTFITPPVISALAGFGVSRIAVHRKLRVGIIVTGGELIPPDAQPQLWQIRDSNGPVLRALLTRCPIVSMADCVTVPDEPERIKSVLGDLLISCDAIFVTGGVSMGTCDCVPPILEQLNSSVVFHGLPIRPGKPILAAVSAGGQPILALPGNPVSVLVTAHRFGLAVLAKKAGIEKPVRPAPSVRLTDGATQPSELWCFRLVRLCGDGIAELIPNRSSADIVAAARSDGFIEIPPGSTGEGPWPFYSWSN